MAETESKAAASSDRKRIMSEVSFPYADLENAVELAQVIHEKAGSSCETEELAAWMGQSATGGTFRTRVGAAKQFGLIDTGQGRATLTQLGRDALDNSGKERAARVQAFLNAELFGVLYEQFKGNLLPPPPALERQIESLGVSPKQKERARQTFMKSATYAGFIDATTGRFVKPGIVNKDEQPPKPPEEKPRGNGTGGDDGTPPGLHPFVQGLLKELPPAGDIWSEEKRKLWLDTAASIFKMIYKDRPPVPPPPVGPLPNTK